MQTYLSGLTSQIASLDAALSRFGTQLEKIPSKEMEFARLERQNKIFSDIYMLLQTRLQEAQIAQATEDSRARVIDTATRPLRPLKPNRKQYVLFGVFFGFAMGLGLALIRETLDRTVHTLEEMVELTGVPSLGLIPHIDTTSLGKRRETVAVPGVNPAPGIVYAVATLGTSGNPIMEAYRTLRTNITFSHPDRRLKTIVFTSPSPGDGKSLTAANLAMTLAQMGNRTILIDGDLRRGSLHKKFGILREPGMSNILVGESTLEECTQNIKIESVASLDIIPSGYFPPNPSELFGGTAMKELLRTLEARYDVVIFDSPPVTLVTDAAIIGAMASGVVVIARAGQTDKGALSYAIEQLNNVRAPIIGTVLNDFEFRRDLRYSNYGATGYYYSAYGYGYGYGSAGRYTSGDDEEKSSSSRKGFFGSIGKRVTDTLSGRRKAS